MKHQPRVDPVVTELMTGIRAAENEIAPSVVLALAAVCKSAGKNIGEVAKGSIVELVEEAFMAGRNGQLILPHTACLLSSKLMDRRELRKGYFESRIRFG